MKRFLTLHSFLRVYPLILLALFVLIEMLVHGRDDRAFRICCYLVVTSSVYLAYPLTREECSANLQLIAPASLFFLVAALQQGSRLMPVYLMLYPAAAFLILLHIAATALKYRNPNELFRKDAAWCCAEEDSRMVYSMVTLVLAACIITMRFEDAPAHAYGYMAMALSALNVLLYLRARNGRTMMLGRRKERRIQTILLSGGNMSEVIPEVEGAILAKAYKRIEQFMQDHKPYLDDKLTLERVSEVLKINKVYISRAINKYTDRNFRQYINWHRVLYSVELMRSDPWLKVIELAFMCGFHSQVTYNMCFKMFMNETPSDMLTRLRLQKPRPEVSRIEVRLPRAEVPPSVQDAQK